MTLTRGRLQPRDGASRLRLKALLAQTGLQGVDPLQQNVFLQIRQPGTGEVLCAQMPAAKFMRMHGIFKFWDHKHTVPSAKGIDDLAVVVRSDGSVRFRTFGRRVQMETPPAGPLQITVAFQDPTGDGRGTCSSTVQEFHAQGGGLRAP